MHSRPAAGVPAILKVGKKQSERLLKDLAVDGGHSKDSRDRRTREWIAATACAASSPSELPVSTAARRRACLDTPLPVQQNVQHDTGIEEDSIHRYFAARYFRYEPMSAFLITPRIERRIGAVSVAETGSATAPRRFAYCFARETTRSSTLKVSFAIYA